jgi:hypothetical protein
MGMRRYVLLGFDANLGSLRHAHLLGGIPMRFSSYGKIKRHFRTVTMLPL